MNVADLFATLRITPNKGSFDAADKLIDGVKTALVGLAAYAGVHALEGMIEDTVELGSHIKELAERSGVATETIQILGGVANRRGSDMESMAGALGKLQNNMHAAAKGGQEQAEAFSKLGVKITDTHGKLRPVEDVFVDISSAQKKVTNEADKGVAVFSTLGKTGRTLIPTMNEIADKGFDNLTASAHALGTVLSDEAIDSLEQFHDSEARVHGALIGLRNQAVVALLPALQSLADRFLEWVKVNRQMIQLKLQVVLNLLIKALEGVAVAGNLALKVFTFLQEHWDIIKVSVLGLTAAMAIFKAGSVAAAVASAAAWMVANIPLVLLAALMTGIILLIDDLITGFQGGDSVIKKFFEDRGLDWDDFQETMERVVGATKFAFETLFNWLADKFGWLSKVLGGIGLMIGEATGATHELDDMRKQHAPKSQAQKDAEEYNAGVSERLDAAREQHNSKIMDDARRAMQESEDLHRTLDAHMADLKNDAAALGISSRPEYTRPGYGSAPATVSITAPVTVQVDGSKDPAATAAAVKEAVSDHFDSEIRKASVGVGGVQ